MPIDRCFRCRRFLDLRNSHVVRLLDTLVYAIPLEPDTAIEAFYDGRIIGTDADAFGVVLRPNDPGPHHICDWCHDTTGPTLHSYRWETKS